MQKILDAILNNDVDTIGSLPVPESYRGITVHADETDMFAGSAEPGQGPAHVPAPGRGTDPGTGSGRGAGRCDGQRHQLQHGMDVDLRAAAHLRVPERYGRTSRWRPGTTCPTTWSARTWPAWCCAPAPGCNAWQPGDEVVAHCLSVELEHPDGHDDTMLDPEQRIWGFETNFGGLAELALVKSNQLMPKPAHLTWEEAASPGLVNSTAYRQLVSRNGADMKQGDTVLIWGASGGLGSYATQMALGGGAIPVCVVSSPEKAEICRRMGAELVIDRNAEGYKFWKDEHNQDPKEWKRFGAKIRELTGGTTPTSCSSTRDGRPSAPASTSPREAARSSPAPPPPASSTRTTTATSG